MKKRAGGYVYFMIRKSHRFYWVPQVRDKQERKAFGWGIWWLWFFFGGSAV
jgi:hypothetical protein